MGSTHLLVQRSDDLLGRFSGFGSVLKSGVQPSITRAMNNTKRACPHNSELRSDAKNGQHTVQGRF